TTVTMGPGSRVFDDTGVVFVNGVQVAWGNASTSTVSFELKAGWNTVEFLVNQWTGQAYINLGLKLSDKVDEMYSGLGVSALSNAAGVLSSNVSQIGKDVVSNSQSITQLRNSLTQTDANVAGKADQTALNSLTGRVENTETGLTAANSSITSLNTSLSQQSRRGANLLPDGTFESYPANYNLSNNRVIVSTDDSHGGNKCIRVTRPNDYNATGIDNSDNHIFSGFQVRDNAVFYLECWIKLDAKSTAMADNVQISVGLSFQYQDESWQWPAVTKAAKDLSSTQWTKVSGYLKSTKSGVKQAMFRISVPNVSSVKAGNSFLIDDIVLTEVTDAYNAQNTADANASAISTLNSTVSQQGDQLTSQGNSITKLTNDLATTNNNVSKKADATALTTLANRVTQTEKDITSTSSSVTTLNNKVDSISVGGTNLIKNSGAMTGWSNVISETYRGNAVLGATTKAGSGYKDLREITLDAPVDAGEYVYSFYAKGAVDGQPMTVFFYNPNTTKSSETSQGIKSGNTDGRAYFTLTTSWARYWVKWKHTPTTGTKRLILCRIERNASNDQTVYISSPKLEVGNVVSDWNNSPTDSASASAVDLLTTTVNQHSDTITSIGNRTTSLENGLSTTNANVAKKADASSLQTLQNTVTQQGNDISSQGTRVTSIENSLTSGANLIPNAKMLNNAQGWDGNATTVDGYAAVSSARGWQPSSAPFEVTPGDTLDLSLMCLVDAAITFAWGLRFDGPSLNNKTVYTNNLSYQAGEKKAVSGTFVVPVGATTARLQPNIGVTAGVTIYNVVVTRRDATTIANSSAIDSLTSTVKTQGDAISSIGNRTTSLENGLATAQNDIGKKADASALQDLRNTVISQGGDLTAANSNITKLQASINRRTVFTVAARGLGSSVPHGVFDESGNNLFTPGRSWALITFAKQNDGSTVISSSKTYDVFGSATDGATMSSDIAALASGSYVCVITYDEPSGNRDKIVSALELLGGTSQVVNSLPYRGAYILLGRKGMKPGDGLELRSPTGSDSNAYISTSVEFVNGIMMGLGAAGGVMMKADANASAITTLQNTVKIQGGNIDSLSSSITALENSLRSTNDTVSKKADTTAVSSLTGRVSQVENTITSQSQSITSLTSSINTISTQGANPWVDGTFESYSDGQVLGGNGTAVVVASQKFTGGKSLKLRRDENDSGNSDKQLGTWQSVREDAKFRFEFWAMMPAGQAPSSGWTTLVGIQSQNAAGQNAWQAAVTVSEASLGARDKWVKFTGIASNNGAGRTRAVVWISTRGATGNGTPGYSLYIDDLVITDVTDAKAAQDASDATASAVSGLTARVTDAEGKITAQAQQQAALATKVDNANSRVDNMAKTLSDSQNTQASLNTSLQSQIDAQAAANIKNQTTLDNTIKSVASITSTQQTHATALEALATQQTTLTSSVGDLSASVQNTAKTVAAVNGTVSSLWSMKVETVNGKKVGAGITLGSNGETSDMILYADRFSLFNRNNATAVPVMVAEGNELYIDTARIKNSSLTSAKIADGSITNAKIGNEIRSNNFVDGSQGWRIAKDGSSQFNNVIVRGRVEANSGVFRGTVQADSFIGDIAVAKSYDSLTFRRNQTVQRNGAYQNRGYSMTVVLACTLVCQTYGTGSGLGYTSDITFNIGGQEVTRRIFVDAGNITGGTTAFELRFAARLDADYNNVGFFIRASGRTAAIDYTCTVENITATAFRTDSSSFS
ncbi:phage tail tip fiber protein, partial [Klebsiella pneumoniae]